MRILALEFSSARRSVALVEAASAGEVQTVARASDQAGRQTQAFRLTVQVLAEAGWEREEIGVLAVGLGPGSYNGIRSAIAIAEGWGLGRPVRVFGVSTVTCLAAQWVQQGARSQFAVAIDAQRGEFYLADYALTATRPTETTPLRLVPAREIETRLQSGGIVCGPELQRWFPAARELIPDAGMLGCLAAGLPATTPAPRLEPIYLRETRFVKSPPPRFR
jgi:tRNA threonylcarbamoyladenosine biosynthesis protein TsaB